MTDVDTNYLKILDELKNKIKDAQVKAALSVNSQLVLLYWEIGKTVLERQKQAGWGAKIVQNLAKDLQSSFPGMKGLSDRNLKYMRKFAQTYSDFEFVQQVVAQLPWGHNIVLMDKATNSIEQIWYAQKLLKTAGRETFWCIKSKVNSITGKR